MASAHGGPLGLTVSSGAATSGASHEHDGGRPPVRAKPATSKNRVLGTAGCARAVTARFRPAATR